MPERSACDKAIRFAQARLKVNDDDLKQGSVEMFSTPNALATSIQRPWGIEGGFAVVYKYKTRSGKKRALRCFRVAMKEDTQFRYERIGPYFAQHVPDITAEFRYYQDGILIEEAMPDGKTEKRPFPLIDMEWVEGMTLFDHVQELCHQNEREQLRQLAQRWLELMIILHDAHVAHGDLAGGNVMVRPDGQLVLVDYDGVYIPEFAGRSAVVKGQPDFQHHDMDHRPFDETMDIFSGLVIYTALLALHHQPDLWMRYTEGNQQVKGQEGGMVFTRRDFLDPIHSTLFRELEQIPDSQLATAVRELKKMCRQPVQHLQFPTHIFDPYHRRKQALQQLQQAIQQGNDQAIITIWDTEKLANDNAAQIYSQRVEQARQLIEAVQRIRLAIQSGQLEQVGNAFDPLLAYSSLLSQEEQELLSLAQRFELASQQGNDAELWNIWHTLHPLCDRHGLFPSSQQKQRLQAAGQAVRALEAFQSLITRPAHSRKAQAIVDAYRTLKDPTVLLPEEREVFEQAQRYVEMYHAIKEYGSKGEDSNVIKVYDEQLVQLFSDLTPDDKRVVALVRERLQLSQALDSRDYGTVIRAGYDFAEKARRAVDDPRFSSALRKFIRNHDVTEAEAQLQGQQVILRWRWPADELVQYMLVLWRYDYMPEPPRREVLETQRCWIAREQGEQVGTHYLSVGACNEVYIRLHLAMRDGAQQPPAWYYAPGRHPATQLVVQRSIAPSGGGWPR